MQNSVSSIASPLDFLIVTPLVYILALNLPERTQRSLVDP